MTELVICRPNPKQTMAMRAKNKHIAFGGARGGGKSWMIQTKSILMCLRYPGIRILIVRRTFPMLEENHIQVMRPQLLDVAKYNQQQRRFTFLNGSTIKFGYCQNDADADNYQGHEYDVIFFDEATQLTENQMQRIGATCRGTNGLPKQIYYTCNPGGVGHAYIKRLFVDRVYEETERPEDYFFVQSLLTDNEALMRNDPDYIRDLERLPNKLKRAWLYGEWDLFEGQFFEELCLRPDRAMCEAAGITPEEALKQRRYTHVIEPFDIPATWTVMRSFDWGYSKPFSCDWWAIDYDGRAYLFLQYYGCAGDPDVGLKLPPQKVFANIREIERTHPALKNRTIHGVADPAIWDASTGESINDEAIKAGVYFDKADHTRIPGWMQCHYRLAFDGDGRPMMYFFNTCHNAIRTLPLLMYSETMAEDLDTTMEDHFADSMRYFCMSRPIMPRPSVKQNTTRPADPLDLINIKIYT